MNIRKVTGLRAVRKSASLSRRALAKGARVSERVEKKADKLIRGNNPSKREKGKVLFEEIFSEALPEIIPIHPALPSAGRSPALTLLIPSLQSSSFFGGTATALIFATKTANSLGLGLRIVETVAHGSVKPNDVASFLKSNNVRFDEERIELITLAGRTYDHYGYLDIHPDDVFIASAWWDAHLLDQLPLNKPYIYLIQDYEPIFYSNSDKYVFAESTYRSNKYIPVCNTKLMYDFMLEKGYEHVQKSGLWFEPAVSVKDVAGRDFNKEKKRMFIYGRPSVSRNLYHFAIHSIDTLFSKEILKSSEWELVMAGQSDISDIILSSGVTIKNLGKMNMDDYYELIMTVDLAISPMMAPHPNYPTLEFASAGAIVVTTGWENKKDLSNYSENILVSDTTTSDFCDKIVEASKRVTGKKQPSMNLPASWDESLDKVILQVTKKIRN